MFRLGVNSFVNSIASNFGLAGNKADTIKDYIPAVAFTLYDGYYIYSPYENTNYLYDQTTGAPVDKNEETFHGLKPYIYYSARYKNGSDDFVITYSLDNFITIQGKINGNYINDSGYVIDPNEVQENGGWATVTYRGATISPETLKENYATDYPYTTSLLAGTRCYYDNSGTIDVADDIFYYYANGVKTTHKSGQDAYDNYNSLLSSGNMKTVLEYEYYKDNGTKYYYDSDQKVIFYVLNGKKLVQYKDQNAVNKYNSEIQNNKSGINYYKSAYEFTNRLYSYNITNLRADQAYTEDGSTQMFPSENYRIFSENGNFKDIEYSNSTFNEQRLAVIRYVIESNLSTAISGFKAYSHSSIDYQLPKIKENEWNIILNHVSVITFLQGINIGSKEYNGYAIVVNNKNKEVVSEEAIYINTNDGKYHRSNDKDLIGSSNITNASLVIDYERNSSINVVTNERTYFYPRSELGCYKSIVNQFEVTPYEDIYRYMDGLTSTSSLLKSKYFTALGRERYTMYRIGESVT